MINLLFVGNTSIDKITNKLNESQTCLGGGAFISAFSSQLLFPNNNSILSSVGKDFPLDDLVEIGVDTSLIHFSPARSNTFIINEKTTKVHLENDQYIKVLLLETIKCKHLHISCREGVEWELVLEKIEYKSISVDIMHSSLDLHIDRIFKVIKSPIFFFCNLEEYKVIKKNIINNREKFSEVSNFIVTSKQGVALKNSRGNYFLSGFPELKNIKSTTGAGDTFIGSFLGAHLADKSIHDSLLWGLAASLVSISDFGITHLKNKKNKIHKYYQKLLGQNEIQF